LERTRRGVTAATVALSATIEEAALDALIDQLEPRLLERLTEHLNTGPSSPWLTVKEAADYLRTTEGAIRKRIERKQLPSYRPEGSQILLHRDDLDRAGPCGREDLS
jgi:excisionase family DNA binding protein